MHFNFKAMSLKDMKSFYLKARDRYYNNDCHDQPIMTDAQFDELEDLIKTKEPSWQGLEKTGAPVADKKSKVELPMYMPSLNKCYPEQIDKFLRRKPKEVYLVSDKLDGASMQVHYLNGKVANVYTRGDGVIGQNITHLKDFLSLPKTIKYTGPLSLRCEAIMSKRNFAPLADKYDNARNLVNGLLNRKASKADSAMFKKIDIVVLGVYSSRVDTGLAFAAEQGLTVVRYNIANKELNASVLTDVLAKRRESSDYEMDGLVLVPAHTTFCYENADKPKWTTAFKVNFDEEAVIAEVVDVVWQISPRGRCIPKIQIKPVRIQGVTVTYCTCNNAVWMKDRRIGPGAQVQMVRSGGVIPKIVRVTKPGKFVGPDVECKVEGVHFISVGKTKAARTEQDVRALTKFLQTLEIEHCAGGTVAKLYEAGATTPFHYMKQATLDSSRLEELVGKAQGKKIHAELRRKLLTVSLKQLMVASNIFPAGTGERVFSMIEAGGISMTKLLSLSFDQAVTKIARIPAFKEKRAELVAQGIHDFNDFLATAKRFITVTDEKPAVKKVVQGKLTGQFITFTGYRSPEQEQAIEAAGGQIVSFSSKTTVLLYKEGGKESTKLDKARAKGIRVCLFNELTI